MFRRNRLTLLVLGIVAVLGVVAVTQSLAAHRRTASIADNDTPTPISAGATLGPPVQSQQSKPIAPASGFLSLVQGKTIYYTNLSYNYDPVSPDPANGQTVSIETWVQLDVRGNVIAQHTISRLPDGNFLQESLILDGQSTVVLGPEYASLEPRLGGGCLRSKSAPAQTIFPLVIDQSALAGLGYAPVQGLPVDTASLPQGLPPGLSPNKTVPITSSVVTWQLKNGANTTYQFEVQSDGKVDVTRSVTVDNLGKVL